jgi:hypothetical protein
MEPRREIGLYPYWIQQHPGAAKELLFTIRKTLVDGQELGPQARQYLIEAITKILEGSTADKALYLSGNKRGRRIGSRIDHRKERDDPGRNDEIYKSLLQLIDKQHKSARSAFRAVGTKFNLSPKTIEGIFRQKRTEAEA